MSRAGNAGRFVKGHATWNKGLKGWQAGGRAKCTQFKKGNYSARWNREHYPIGALRLERDGLQIKVSDGKWIPLTRYVWETERGPIPRGMVVRIVNGDVCDARIENLRLDTRAELMKHNTVHRYPRELARLIQLRGALNRQINRRLSA